MSEAMVSNTESRLIYVRILGEGTNVFRPAFVTPSGMNTFRLIAPPDYCPESENWEFVPGTTIRVEPHSFGDENVFIAVSALEV